MTRRRPQEIVQFFTKMIADEECITIVPRQEEFKPYQRTFLDGLRRIPAQITTPPGRNPFEYALGHKGHWVIIWVPDE